MMSPGEAYASGTAEISASLRLSSAFLMPFMEQGNLFNQFTTSRGYDVHGNSSASVGSFKAGYEGDPWWADDPNGNAPDWNLGQFEVPSLG